MIALHDNLVILCRSPLQTGSSGPPTNRLTIRNCILDTVLLRWTRHVILNSFTSQIGMHSPVFSQICWALSSYFISTRCTYICSCTSSPAVLHLIHLTHDDHNDAALPVDSSPRPQLRCPAYFVLPLYSSQRCVAPPTRCVAPPDGASLRPHGVAVAVVVCQVLSNGCNQLL